MANDAAHWLILMRHAKSAWPDGVADHERPLAPRGRRDAPAAGRWLRARSCLPGLVLCSPARRARETWELAQPELGVSPEVSFEPRVYAAAAGDLLGLAGQVPEDAGTLLIVGHDPAMHRLTLDLADARGSGVNALQQVRLKFPTAAVAVLAFTGRWQDLGPGDARLTGFFRPGDRAAAS